jgi:hypothetical protein
MIPTYIYRTLSVALVIISRINTSHSPSSVPTSVPTTLPTSVPVTSAPSINGETLLPTSFPTLSPIINSRNYGSLRIFNNFERTSDLFLKLKSTWNPSFMFSNFNYKGVNVVGSCEDWRYFSSSATNPPVDTLDFYSMTAVFDYQNLEFPLSTNEITVTCADHEKVNAFLQSMQSSSPLDLQCNEHIWRIVSCSFGLVFCIDCKKVCNWYFTPPPIPTSFQILSINF